MMDSNNTDQPNKDLAENDVSTSRDELVAEINRIRNKIGGTPALSDFEKHSQYDTEEIYRHFEWYSNVLKAAEAVSTATDDSADQPEQKDELPVKSTTRKLNSDEVVDPTSVSADSDSLVHSKADCTREELLNEIIRVSEQLNRKPRTIEFHRNSHCGSNDTFSYFDSWGETVDAAIAYRSTGQSAARTEDPRLITVHVTDDGTPLRGAQVTVENTDDSTVQTDEQGSIEIPVSEETDQVSLEITHRQWASKDLNTTSSDDTHSYTVDVSESDWQTDIDKEDSPSQSENKDEPSDVISTILRDMDRLEEE